VPTTGRRRLSTLASALVIVGGAAIVAGSFLPWSAGDATPLFAFGWQGGDGGWFPGWSGMGIILAGLVVLLSGLVVVGGGIATISRRWAWTLTMLACTVAASVGWMGFQGAVNRWGHFSHPYIPGYGAHAGEPGMGMWFILVGALLGGLASLMARGPRSISRPL